MLTALRWPAFIFGVTHDEDVPRKTHLPLILGLDDLAAIFVSIQFDDNTKSDGYLNKAYCS